MCPPHNWLPRRTVSGPTHRSAPTESIAMFISPGRAGGDRAPPLLVDRGAQQRAAEDASLYGCTTGGAQQRADVPKAWLPPAKFRSEIWLAVIGIGPYERTRGYGFPRRFAPRNDSTNAGSRSAGPSSTSFSARRSVRNDRRHRSLPLSSHVSMSPVNARSEAPAPVSPKSP